MFDRRAADYWGFMVLAGLIVGSFVFFPLFWMISTSIKPVDETFQPIPSLFPKQPTLTNYYEALLKTDLLVFLRNSLVVSASASFLGVIVGAMAGYSFSKFSYPGRRPLMLLLLTAQMFPFSVLLVTLYPTMRSLGLADSYLGLILSYITFALPVSVWMLRSYIDQVPDELLEVARVDGASEGTLFLRVVIPVIAPGLAAAAVYNFIWAWNDLLYAVTLITSAERRTIAPGLLATYLGEVQANWGGMMASSVLVSLPVLAIFVLMQRYLVEGLMAGSLKG